VFFIFGFDNMWKVVFALSLHAPFMAAMRQNPAWITSNFDESNRPSNSMSKYGRISSSALAATVQEPEKFSGGIFAKAAPEMLIKQTDYLKNPKPMVSKKVEDAKAEDKEPKSLYSTEQCLSLLQDALVAFNSTASRELLGELNRLRQQKDVGQEATTELLNGLLQNGPDADSLPFWTRIKTLARFSKRARLASLSRVLDYTTPPPSTEDAEKPDTSEDLQRRRRRALVTILQSLTSDYDLAKADNTKKSRPAIRILEKKSRQEQQTSRKNDGEDLTSRRPDGLETPRYDVLETKANTFEVRRYEDYAVCSVSMNKPRPKDSSKTDASVADPSAGGAKAFGALAGYLFGKNQEEKAMKMTTPVLFSDEKESNEKKMSFVLPSDYWENESVLSSAPTPLEGSGVALDRVKGSTRAVVMFGGYASKKSTEQQTKTLLKTLEGVGNWKVVDGESVVVAQYNDPFTPPWKRLNEVSIAIESS